MTIANSNAAVVSPKLSRHAWEMRDLQGLVKASYANPAYVKETCQTPLRDLDPKNSAEACLDILFSGQCELTIAVKCLAG